MSVGEMSDGERSDDMAKMSRNKNSSSSFNECDFEFENELEAYKDRLGHRFI